MKKYGVIILIVLIICLIGAVIWEVYDGATISGEVIEVSENNFMIVGDDGLKIVISFSQLNETLKVEEGDSVIIKYKGVILETSPAKIANIKKIRKE